MSIDAFLSALDSARPLVAAPEVAAAWERPSSLPDMTVGALTAHLVVAVAGIDPLLDRPVPDGVDVGDMSTYYSGEEFPASWLEAGNAYIADAARQGPVAVLARFDEVRDRLRSRLPVEPPHRLMRVPSPADRYMHLDDYLLTRTVEVVVHSDDLAASVSLPSPKFPVETGDAVITHFIEICRQRHGDGAVIRAFTRPERDAVQALRVF